MVNTSGKLNPNTIIEKKKPYCLRCGQEKIKGFWELGCKVWGVYYPKHYWNTSKKI